MPEPSGQQSGKSSDPTGPLADPPSGYESSNDDHFSDAHEGPGELSSNPSDGAHIAVENSATGPKLEPPTTPQVPASPDAPASSGPSIPGAFDFDENPIAVVAGASTVSSSNSMQESPASNTEPSNALTSLDTQGAAPSPEKVDSPIIVKWNEKKDKIRPKVKGEKQRIERLVQEQRDRSRSPCSRRNVSGTSMKLEADSFSDIHSPSEDLSPCPSPRFDNGRCLSPSRSQPPSRPRSPTHSPSRPLSPHPQSPTSPTVGQISLPLAPSKPTEPVIQIHETLKDQVEKPVAAALEEPTISTADADSNAVHGKELIDDPVMEAIEQSRGSTIDESEATNGQEEVKEEDMNKNMKEDVNEDVNEELNEVMKEDVKEDVKEEGEEENEEEEDDDGFGDDDFDDFGEVAEGDFDDFEAFEEADPAASFPAPTEAQPEPRPQPTFSIPETPIPILEFGVSDTLGDALANAMDTMFPSESGQKRMPSSVDGQPFLTERSHSLWNQLCAPPPLQPPNWKVSRIRRLFLVSLGVPVDLDEILPAETKQKKLVLPSVHLPRRSMDSRPSSRNRNSRSQSGTRSNQDDGGQSKGQSGTLDISSARILCSTSDVALSNFTVEELHEHIRQLKEMTQLAGDNLTYWLEKRNSAQGDKETFETVIESLVGYARKKRQNG